MDVTTLTAGDRIYRWVLTGSSGGGAYDASDIQELTVVRVNRLTVTVETNGGAVLRIKHADIRGRVDW